jgi:hypothetical protein
MGHGPWSGVVNVQTALRGLTKWVTPTPPSAVHVGYADPPSAVHIGYADPPSPQLHGRPNLHGV